MSFRQHQILYFWAQVRALALSTLLGALVLSPVQAALAPELDVVTNPLATDEQAVGWHFASDGEPMNVAQNTTIDRIYRQNQAITRPPSVAAPPRPPQRPNTIVKPQSLAPNDFPSLRRSDQIDTPWIIAPEDRPK